MGEGCQLDPPERPQSVPELPDQETLNWAFHTLIALFAQLREMAVRAPGSQTPVVAYRIPWHTRVSLPIVGGLSKSSVMRLSGAEERSLLLLLLCPWASLT